LRAIACPLFLVALTGCERTADDASIEQTIAPHAARLWGNVVIGHEVRALTECGTETGIWLTDRTDGDLAATYEGLATGPYEPVFMALEGRREPAPETGFGADYDGAFTVERVLRAEREGFGCALDLAGVLFRATGNEPSWQLTVRDDAVSFASMSAGTRQFDNPVLTQMEDAVRVRAGDDDLLVEIEDRRCTDSMSGSVYALSAAVRLDGSVYRGCAVEGWPDAN
jgi:putative lipoprotein